jgi:transposase
MSIEKAMIDELMSIGVDICKDVFHLVGFDPSGERVLLKKIKRHQLEQVLMNFQAVFSGWRLA